MRSVATSPLSKLGPGLLVPPRASFATLRCRPDRPGRFFSRQAGSSRSAVREIVPPAPFCRFLGSMRNVESVSQSVHRHQWGIEAVRHTSYCIAASELVKKKWSTECEGKSVYLQYWETYFFLHSLFFPWTAPTRRCVLADLMQPDCRNDETRRNTRHFEHSPHRQRHYLAMFLMAGPHHVYFV